MSEIIVREKMEETGSATLAIRRRRATYDGLKLRHSNSYVAVQQQK